MNEQQRTEVSLWRLGVLFRARTCRFDDAHIKLGNSLTGGQNRIRHSGMAETRNNSDRLNRRDGTACEGNGSHLDMLHRCGD